MMKNMKLVLVVIFILAEGAGIGYFAHKASKLSMELGDTKEELSDAQQIVDKTEPGYNRLLKEKGEMDAKYAELSKKYQAIEVDRDNLVKQSKKLLDLRSRSEDVLATFEKMKEEKNALEEERNQLSTKSQELQARVDQMSGSTSEIQKERDRLKENYDKLQKNKPKVQNYQEQVTKLRAELLDIKNEKKLIEAENKKTINEIMKKITTSEIELNKSRTDIAKLKQEKINQDIEAKELKDKIDSLNKTYADAVKKNRDLERKAADIPGKFTEIARQNKALVKGTAQMHYNLGVFYTKHKEYKRAIAEFGKAVEINPDDAYSHFNLGYIYAEYMVDRKQSVAHFRQFLRLAKSDDKDVDWVKKYLLTWETYEGKKIME